MYTYTRQDAADFLWISTRSIDRYIKSGKLRSKKEWKIVYLTSWWMAFTDFVTNNWEILSVKKNGKIEITYHVTDDEIRVMETNLYGGSAKNTYWLYDKNKNLWLEKDAEIKLDKENKTWTAIVSEIY